MDLSIWHLEEGDSPVAATAIHAGHELRPDVAAVIALDEAERLREEDPFTDRWTAIAETRLIGLRSRFEVDLNRPRDKAVYIQPEDAWGLHVWQTDPPPEMVQKSLRQYDAFYAEAQRVFTRLEQQFGRFVVFDLHTYNHRRQGPDGPPANPEENPEVNIGTGTMDSARWAPVVERLMTDLRNFDFLGRQLDVRENVKFQGGNFVRWIHQTFPETGCALAIELKKFFMDEWTGQPQMQALEAIGAALKSTVPGVLEDLRKL